jgi:hypothetical protein
MKGVVGSLTLEQIDTILNRNGTILIFCSTSWMEQSVLCTLKRDGRKVDPYLITIQEAECIYHKRYPTLAALEAAEPFNLRKFTIDKTR